MRFGSKVNWKIQFSVTSLVVKPLFSSRHYIKVVSWNHHWYRSILQGVPHNGLHNGFPIWPIMVCMTEKALTDVYIWCNFLAVISQLNYQQSMPELIWETIRRGHVPGNHDYYIRFSTYYGSLFKFPSRRTHQGLLLVYFCAWFTMMCSWLLCVCKNDS